MSDDLRTRIAAVLSQHDAFGTDFVECLCGAEFDNAQVILNEFQPIWELHLADAVIRELGLRLDLEHRVSSYIISRMLRKFEVRTRWVTGWSNWTADE